jgi:hypothetical protein
MDAALAITRAFSTAPASNNALNVFISLSCLQGCGISGNNMVKARYICNTGFTMLAKKTATLNLRIDPSLKEALREAAVRGHRSIAIPEQEALFRDERD